VEGIITVLGKFKSQLKCLSKHIHFLYSVNVRSEVGTVVSSFTRTMFDEELGKSSSNKIDH
jgi:hypothetical protein